MKITNKAEWNPGWISRDFNCCSALVRPRGSWDEAASKIFLSASILLLVFENHHGDLTNFSSKKNYAMNFTWLFTSRAAAFHFQRYFLLGDQSVSVCRAQFVLILIRISVRKFKSSQNKVIIIIKKVLNFFILHDKWYQTFMFLFNNCYSFNNWYNLTKFELFN